MRTNHRSQLASIGSARARTRRRKKEVSRLLWNLALKGRDLGRNALLAARMPPWRSKFLIALLGVCFAVLLGRAFFLATNPLNRLRANLVVANQPQDSLSALVQQATKLSALSQNIESVSISSLRAAMEDSVATAQRAALDFNAQSNAWSELRGKIKDDSSTYESLRAQLADLQRMQKEEVVRLKSLLDEAQRPSIFADAFNLFLSFFVGVLSSLIASGLYEKWQTRRRGAG
jgi:hypothetical protein